MVVLVRRLSLDSDDLGFPDRDVVSCCVGRIPGKGRGAVGVFTNYGKRALESDNRRSQGG